MDIKKLSDIIIYTSSRGRNGACAKEICDKFDLKLDILIKIIEILTSCFHEYVILSNDDDEYYYDNYEEYDNYDFENMIDEIESIVNYDTIIKLNISIKNINEKLNLYDSIKIIQLLQENNLSKKSVNNLLDSNSRKYEYIYKGNNSSVQETAIIKKNIIECIVKQKKCSFNYSDETKFNICSDVDMLSVYYDKILKKYQVIFKDKGNIKKISLNAVNPISFKISEKKYEFDNEFSLNEYLKKIRKCEMVIRVYDEANVMKKLKYVLKGYDVKEEIFKEYSLFAFNTENPENFKDLINSFGKSVIVVKPENLRNEIIKEIKICSKNYDKYKTMN